MNLREERLNRGLSAAAAAEQMGLANRQTLLGAERGGGVRPENAKKIADFYGYRVTDIWPVEDPVPGAAA